MKAKNAMCHRLLILLLFGTLLPLAAWGGYSELEGQITPTLRYRNLQRGHELRAEICNDSDALIQEMLVHVSGKGDGKILWWSLLQADGIAPGQCRAVAARDHDQGFPFVDTEELYFRLAQIDYGPLRPAESWNNPASALTDVETDPKQISARFCNRGDEDMDSVQLLLYAFDSSARVLWRERLFGPPLRKGDCQLLQHSRTARYELVDHYGYILLPPVAVSPPKEGVLAEGLRYEELTLRNKRFRGQICQQGDPIREGLFLLFRAADPDSGRLRWDEAVFLPQLPADSCTAFIQRTWHTRLPAGWSILPLHPLGQGVNRLP